MGYVPFSTENADYVLVYAAHFSDTDDDIFNDEKIKSLDAIVIENSGWPPETMSCSYNGVSFLPPAYKTIITQSHKQSKFIYLVDACPSVLGRAASYALMGVPLVCGAYSVAEARKDIRNACEHEKTDRRQFLKGLGKGLFGMWLLNGYSGLLFGTLSEGETSNVIESAAASVHRIPPSPLLEARNCAAARKIEEFVAPLLKGYKEKKPKIAIVFGGGHSGMKECLQGKEWRDSVLYAYKQVNYLGLDIYTLPDVWEMWPSYLNSGDYQLFDQNWCSQYYNSKLF
ncbi:MAG: hypothetical protein WC852_01705 [Candidatus Nanoarchaeia archaeon]|jgi:hypothetical protein